MLRTFMWIVLAIGLFFLTIVAYLFSILPPVHADPVPFTSLDLVEEYTELKIPPDSKLLKGIRNPAWTGWLYCKVLLSRAGFQSLKSQFPSGSWCHDRNAFIGTPYGRIPAELLDDPEIRSSRRIWVSFRRTPDSWVRVMLVNDEKSAPMAFIYRFN